ncbi:hypothetical protein [Sulfurimonas crateris]|nr:hypothetical protein [Sulfurimonas crateris]
MSLEEFLTNNEPNKRKSVFEKHRDTIFTLLEKEYSQKQVIEYLRSVSKNKTGITDSNLSKWLKRNKTKLQSDPEKIISIKPLIKTVNSDEKQQQKSNTAKKEKSYHDMTEEERREETKKSLHEAVMTMYPKPAYLGDINKE